MGSLFVLWPLAFFVGCVICIIGAKHDSKMKKIDHIVNSRFSAWYSDPFDSKEDAIKFIKDNKKHFIGHERQIESYLNW